MKLSLDLRVGAVAWHAMSETASATPANTQFNCSHTISFNSEDQTPEEIRLVEPTSSWDWDSFNASFCSSFTDSGNASADSWLLQDGASTDFCLNQFNSAFLQVVVSRIEQLPNSKLNSKSLRTCTVKMQHGTRKLKCKQDNKYTFECLGIYECRITGAEKATQHLKILARKDDNTKIGECKIDLSRFPVDITLRFEAKLNHGDEPVASAVILLTITGVQFQRSAAPPPIEQDFETIYEKVKLNYSPKNSLMSLGDVGWLHVKVQRAYNLESRDMNGFSDPFCVLQLPNQYLRTHTINRTLNPVWERDFIMPVRDVHNCLKVSLFDADGDGAAFLGSVLIPLLRIKNGRAIWYALTDDFSGKSCKGRVLLQMSLFYNHFRAALACLKAPENDIAASKPKFLFSCIVNRHIVKIRKNVARLEAHRATFSDALRFYQWIFSWEDWKTSFASLILFQLLVWKGQIFMIPFGIAAFMIVSRLNTAYSLVYGQLPRPWKQLTEEVDGFESGISSDNEKETKVKTRSNTTMEKLTKATLSGQNMLDYIASLIERFIGVFNWSEPWISTLMVFILILAGSVLLFVPFRALLSIWGLRKFTKRLFKPRSHSSNTLLNLISRVPSKPELKSYEEMEVNENCQFE